MRAVVEDGAALHGLELVELHFTPRGGRWRLRIFVDRKGGVTVNECARISRDLSRTLDHGELIPHAYVLEVSSPGVNRPMKSEADFARAEGRRVRMHMEQGKTLVGVVVSASNGKVSLRLSDGRIHKADLDGLESASLDVSLRKH